MSNSFEDFVNNNLGIRMPLIEDHGHPHSSAKAAGILGSKYLDLNNNYLYEKTGEDNSSDWVKIASLGERRDVAKGPNFSIQFNSGDVLAGNQYLTFLNNELSGVSGFFDELKVDTIIADSMEVTGDLAVGGDFYASGEAFFGEEKPSLNRAVFRIQPSSLRGHNDAGQVRGGPQNSQANGSITIDITSASPYFGTYSSLRMNFMKNGGSYSFSTSGNVLILNVPMLTGKGASNARWYPNVGTVRDWLNTQVGVSAVLSSGVDPNKSGIQADGPGYIQPEKAITKSIQSLGFHYDLVYSGEQLSGASGFFDDFKVSGDLAVGGNLYVSGETFVQSVTDVSVTGDISGYKLEGTSGVFDLISGSSGDFDNLFVSGISEITSGQFSEQLTISGMTVLTGIDDIRTTAGGPDYAIQYGSGTGFYGSSNLIYSREQLSGASGFFDDFKVSGDLAVGGNLYVSGETFVQSVTDVSVTGDISGYKLEGTSGVFDLISGSSGDFDNLFVSGISEITSGQFSEQLTISGVSVLTGVETGHFVTTGETGIFVTTGQTGDFVTTGLTGDFVTTGETGIFVTTGQTGDFVTTGLTGDFVTTGETGIFVTTGQTGDFVTTGLTGDFVTTGETGIFVTTGQTGDFVTTGLTGDFVTTGETGIFVTTGQTGDFVTTGLTGDFVTTGETGIFVTTGQTGDFVTTGLTGDFVTTGETGIFVTTGQTGDFVTTGFSGLIEITSGQFTEQLTISGNPVLTGSVGARPEGPDFAVQFGSGDTLSGNQYLLYSGNQLSGASGTFDDFFVSGVSQITSGQFSEQLTISGNPVLTGVDGISAVPGGPNNSIQFNSGNTFEGTTGLLYVSGQLSGLSGNFSEYLNIGTGDDSDTILAATGDGVEIFDNLTVSGTVSGISGIFDNLTISGWNPVLTGALAESDSFTDIEYNSSGDITGSLNWTDNGRSTLIKVKQFNYNESGLLTGVISKDGTYTEQLTKILTYDSSGNLESIQKNYI